MSDLPENIPDDLRKQLETVLGFKTHPNPADIWAVVREWLAERG